MWKNIVATITSLVFVCTLGVQVASAQVFADITLKIFPEFPKVGDTVTASVTSSDVNLDFQDITWYVNGVRALSGVAETSTIFTIEPDVKTYSVRAVIGDSAGQLVRERVITPGNVILLWEAVDSYVPYWYRGKALMPAEGTVRITAVPVGSDSLDKLFFVWRQGTNSLANLSGYAKNSIVLRNNVLLDSMDVSVQVSSANGGYQATGSVSIPRTESDVRLWAPRPGQASLYEQNGTLRLFGDTATIEALPYGVTTGVNLRGLTFDWLLNQIPYVYGDNEADNSIYISRSPTPINLDLTIQSINHLLQKVSLQKRLVFE